jgi:MFS transporter, AAHS family, benzoate transport protein
MAEASRPRAPVDSRVAILLVLQLATGIIVSPAGTFLPVYLADAGYQAVFIAGAFTLQRIMGLVSSLAGGSLADLLDRRKTLLFGQIGLFAGGLVFLSRSPGVILPLWALYGVGMTLNTLGSQSYLMDAAGARNLGLLTALYYWGFTVGGSVGNPMAGLLIGQLGYAGLAAVFGVLGLGAIALTMAALPRLPRASGSRRAAPRAVSGSPPGARLLGFGDIARRPEVLLLAGLRFLPTFCYGMLTVFVPLLLKRAGAPNTTIALYATVSSLVAAASQLGAGRLADRIGPRLPSVGAYLVFAASALGIGLCSQRLWPVMACGVVGMAAAWSLSVLVPPLVALVTDGPERGRVLGFVHLFWNLAMILGSLVGGLLFERRGGLPFLIGGAAVLVAPVLVVVFFRLPRLARAA